MRTLAALGILSLVGAVLAQDNRLPQEEAKGYAKLCADRAAAVLTEPQIKMTVDADRPSATRGEGGGAMLIPDKNLTEKAIAGAAKDTVVPVGQLWLRKWTLAIAGKPVPDEKLRIIRVTVQDKERPMPLLLLGVRKKGDKDRELVIYGNGPEPLQVLPLRKLDQIQDLPATLEWSSSEKHPDNLTLNLLGKYETVLKITRTGK